MSKKSKRTRDAKSGQFVPDGTEKKRPTTTVGETVKTGPIKKRR